MSEVGGQKRRLGTQIDYVWQTANALPSKICVRADSEGEYFEIRNKKTVETQKPRQKKRNVVEKESKS